MSVKIKKKDGQIVVTVPVGEALDLKVQRPLQAPFGIGSAVREAAWGLINVNAKKLLDGFKPEVVTSVVEDGNVVITFDSQLPEEMIYGDG